MNFVYDFNSLYFVCSLIRRDDARHETRHTTLILITLTAEFGAQNNAIMHMQEYLRTPEKRRKVIIVN